LAELQDRYGERVSPLQLDVTNAEDVAGTVSAVNDLQLLINNAGVVHGQDLTAGEIVQQARNEMEVNYFAPLNLLQQLAPTLKRNGGGTVVNVSSVGGLTNFPLYPTYSASKAAIHSLTQGARMLLAAQGTYVAGVYPGPVDTDMTRAIEMDKATPQDVANAILDGLEAGQEDIFPDPFAKQFGEQYQSSPKASERQFAAMASPAEQLG
jgi:short-subunit dehydrogenase